MAHGGADTIVEPKIGEMSAEALKKQRYDVQWKVYEGVEHEGCSEEWDDVVTFMESVIPDVPGFDPRLP